MRVRETIPTTPIETETTVRGDEVRVLTSCKAGKVVPVYYAPLLREDRVSKGKIRINLDMAETVFPLMNSVHVTAFAHFVPWTAMRTPDGVLRFAGLDEFNRSYMKKPELHNGTPIPFFRSFAASGAELSQITRTMGLHVGQTGTIQYAVIDAYREVVNYRREARSRHLPRHQPSNELARAFWKNPDMAHVVPDYESAMQDGAVPLTFAKPQLLIRGIGRASVSTISTTGNRAVFEGENTPATYPLAVPANSAALHFNAVTNGTPKIFAELESAGITLSLNNIEAVKQTQAFAKIREQYQGLKDGHIIDLLMQGIRVPDESLKQPILLARDSTVFGYTERKAMDGANLDKSVTTGKATIDLNFRTPPMSTGGVILVTLEIVPEQLWERKQDPFLHMTDPARFPDFLRDYLDPEKVDVVRNNRADVHHAAPDGIFGYEPLNSRWKRSFTRIGGKYRRPATAGFVEDRQRFWSIEQVNPTLTTDFYLCPDNFPHTVFADQLADPFEVLALGSLEIVGNTVFGRQLEEDGGDFAAVASKVDYTRVPK